MFKTGGILPGSVPVLGQQAFVTSRISKIPRNPSQAEEDEKESLHEEIHFETGM